MYGVGSIFWVVGLGTFLIRRDRLCVFDFGLGSLFSVVGSETIFQIVGNDCVWSLVSAIYILGRWARLGFGVLQFGSVFFGSWVRLCFMVVGICYIFACRDQLWTFAFWGLG